MLPNIQHLHVLEISKTETEARSNEGPHEDGYKSLNPTRLQVHFLRGRHWSRNGHFARLKGARGDLSCG